MPTSAPRLRQLAGASLAGTVLLAVLAVGAPAGAAPAPVPGPGPASGALAAEVAQLDRDVARVGDELAAGAVAYEAAQQRLARLTQDAFAAEAGAEARAAEAERARSSFDGLARAAYKGGGVPPIITALLSGDPRSVGDLAYVQRTVDVVGNVRREAVRAAYLRQAGAGEAVVQSAVDRQEALRQRQALDAQVAALRATADRLTAQLASTAARLEVAKAQEAAARSAALRAAQERAARLAAAQQAAQLAAAQRAVQAQGQAPGTSVTVPGALPAPVTDGRSCQPPGPYGEANGFLSDAGLCPLDVGRGHRLRTDAARAFNALNAAHIASVGTPLCVTDSYRSYAAQVDVFKRKPALAATPGRSQHGWGLALDLCGGVQTFGSGAHEWMRANAPQFGWVHPRWAQRGGSRPEAWHWEYVG